MAGVNYAGAIISAWTNSVNSGFDRWNGALDEIQERQYTSDRFVSDVLGSWMDLASFWSVPLDLLRDRKRVVRFPIKTTTTDAIETIAIANFGVFALKTNDLPKVDDNAVFIPAAKVSATLTGQGRFLVVQLQKLTVPLAVGTYLGPITRQDDPNVTVASVRVDVTA